MKYFDKNNILIKLGNTLINEDGTIRKVALASDCETLGFIPLNVENWTDKMGVEPLERFNLKEWSIDLKNYNTVYYHVTLAKNVNSNLKEGLIPKIGERSLEIGEKEPLVYLFPNQEDMECAVMQWLGDWYEDEYGENVKLACLKVEVPYQFPIENGEVEYECTSKYTIPSKYISFFKYVS